MDEQALRGLIARVKGGKVSRRSFLQRMAALGLTAPMASQMLSYCGVAHAKSPFQYKPSKRGGGGALKVLWWQGVTMPVPSLPAQLRAIGGPTRSVGHEAREPQQFVA
jgi:peptide/nickel transport system substrate-binding protein